MEEVLPNKLDRQIYEFLYDRRATPPTMVEIIDHLSSRTVGTQAHFNRRVRELYEVFDCNATRMGKNYVYQLRGWSKTSANKRVSVSRKIRAQVLIHQRCAQCGKTPSEDHVKLEVDHKLPLTWGGTSDFDNLQALCHPCNQGKRDFFATFNEHSDKIRAAATHTEPHKRIGETLKAFHNAGLEAPSEVIGLVACLIQYQDDWQKRTRELRELGWEYTIRKRKEDGRMRSYYKLVKWTAWPNEPIAPLIKRIEAKKKIARQERTS
ncbi:hypothetical protein GCM10017709_14990 [Glutamicibacter nicotianae]|uniref:HNH nuclease domain-containing protein n=1 Tax=Glutamicibacter nicotianae TaxID=37929 RepID=A0ABQ0RJ82_GLUNI|nr:hypothetical protein ANI01nite_07830 [Glutamicibacter nicotianae]